MFKQRYSRPLYSHVSGWLDPQYDEKIYEGMDATLAHIQHIHEVVLKTAEENPALGSTALCTRILRDLGHPDIPIVVKSSRPTWN